MRILLLLESIDGEAHEGYLEYTIEIERTIAAVWKKEEIGTFAGQRIILRVGRNVLLEVLFKNGRYLLWLKLVKLTDESYLGPKSSEYYAPVYGGRGTNRAGSIGLDRQKDIIPEKMYKEILRKGGFKDLDESFDRLIQSEFEISDKEKIVNMVSKSAKMMLIGRDNEQELNDLFESKEKEEVKIANWLKYLGMKAKKFVFVESTY
jgi:hypothetical protein